MLQAVCKEFQDSYSTSTSSFNYDDKWFPYLILASFFGNAMLYGVIAYDPKLRVHPMTLFATVAFLDGSLFWIYFVEPYMCPVYQHNIFYAVTFPFTLNADTALQYYDSAGFFVWFSFLKSFFWTASMVFNICICFDLILMIKHPFDSKAKRIVKYHISSYTIGIIAGLEKVFFPEALGGQSYLGWTQLISFICFMIMGLFSSFWACSKLSKPGISREVRMLVLKRHVSYIICYFLCNLYLMMQGIQKLNESSTRGKWWINASEIAYFSQGLIIPAIRSVEPYFFRQAWYNIKMPFVICFRFLLCFKSTT